MQLPRRHILRLAPSALALAALAGIAHAQKYPSRPVRVLVGATAGGGTDIMARLMGQWLSDRLGQPFIVEDRAGAGTNLATEVVVRAPPDGHTLLLVTAANAINAALYPSLNFNFIRDIAPVAGLMRVPLVMVVNPSLPAKTVPEFIAYAKANPGKISMATGVKGGAPHVAGELFTLLTGVNMVQVAYKGLSLALSDLLADHVQVLFSGVPAAIEFIRAGKLRALAVTTKKRCPIFRRSLISCRVSRQVNGTASAHRTTRPPMLSRRLMARSTPALPIPG
jgi:tripartite-type tricarboxylate transporter receptor subunit TctC